MLGQRRRRWTNIVPTLGQCIVSSVRSDTSLNVDWNVDRHCIAGHYITYQAIFDNMNLQYKIYGYQARWSLYPDSQTARVNEFR